MDQSIAQDLRKALAYLKAGNPQAARPLLVDILKRDPEVEQAWYMLSFAVPNEERQIYALNQALQLNPHNEKARTRLEKLTGRPAPSAPALQDSPREATSEPARREPDPEPEPKRSFFSRPDKKEEKEEPSPPAVEKPAAPAQSEADLLSQRLFGGDPAEDSTVDSEAAPAEPTWASSPSSGDGEPSDEPVKKPKPKRLRRVLLFVLFAVIVVGGGSALYLGGFLPFGPGQGAGGPNELAVEDTAEPSETPAPTETMTPTFTLVPTETATQMAAATLLPTSTPGPTATNPPVSPAVAQGMAQVQVQVISIRGAAGDVFVTGNLVSQTAIQEALSGAFFSPEFASQMDNEERVLRVLGLSEPGYSMENHSKNTWVEVSGGLFDPVSGYIRVAGLEFGGPQKHTFAFEFAQVLANMRLDLVDMGYYPNCAFPEQECRAMMALFKGDAALVQEQWLDRNATADERAAIEGGLEQVFFISEPFPPAFAEHEIEFPYVQGLEFVRYLLGSGGWNRVNDAYLNPPTTTEQILHPEKYVTGEEAVEIEDTLLSTVLDSSWREIKNDSLGEWRTFLILAYGKDAAARLPEDQAESAAAGWGGNHYQVYINDGTAKMVLVSHWVWDTPGDAGDFSAAITEMLSARFGEDPIDVSGSICWSSFDSVNCLISLAEETIWVIAPDEEMAGSLLSLYPTE